MRKLVVLCAVALSVILLLVTSGCQQQPATFTSILELYAQKATLEEANSIIGRTVPAPTYLPEGYEIQEVYIEHNTYEVTRSKVMLLISDEEIPKKLVSHTDAAGTRQRYELQCKMNMKITWSERGIPGGLKLPGERVNIDGTKGVIVDRDDHNDLWWQPRPDPGQDGMFNLFLSANKRIPKKELVKIAESVRW